MMGDIIQGSRESADHAKTQRVVFDWIRDDCPLGIQMMFTPELSAKLVDRLTGSRTSFKESVE